MSELDLEDGSSLIKYNPSLVDLNSTAAQKFAVGGGNHVSRLTFAIVMFESAERLSFTGYRLTGGF